MIKKTPHKRENRRGGEWKEEGRQAGIRITFELRVTEKQTQKKKKTSLLLFSLHPKRREILNQETNLHS